MQMRPNEPKKVRLAEPYGFSPFSQHAITSKFSSVYPQINPAGVCAGLCYEYARRSNKYDIRQPNKDFISKLRTKAQPESFNNVDVNFHYDGDKFFVVKGEQGNFAKRVALYQNSQNDDLMGKYLPIQNLSNNFDMNGFLKAQNQNGSFINNSKVIGLHFLDTQTGIGHATAIELVRNTQGNTMGYKFFDPNEGEWLFTKSQPEQNLRYFNKVINERIQYYNNLGMKKVRVVDIEGPLKERGLLSGNKYNVQDNNFDLNEIENLMTKGKHIGLQSNDLLYWTGELLYLSGKKPRNKTEQDRINKDMQLMGRVLMSPETEGLKLIASVSSKNRTQTLDILRSNNNYIPSLSMQQALGISLNNKTDDISKDLLTHGINHKIKMIDQYNRQQYMNKTSDAQIQNLIKTNATLEQIIPDKTQYLSTEKVKIQRLDDNVTLNLSQGSRNTTFSIGLNEQELFDFVDRQMAKLKPGQTELWFERDEMPKIEIRSNNKVIGRW